MIYKALLTFSIVAFLILPAGVKCQPRIQDAAVWTNIYLEKKIVKRLNIHLNQETRFNENFSRLGFAYFDLGVTYKIASFLNTSVAYVFIEKFYINNHNTSDYYSTRHQFYYNITLKQEFNKFRINLREQIQNQVKDIYSSDDGDVPYYYLRNKLTIKYDLSRRLTPYVADEINYQLSNPLGNEIDRNRFFGGLFYKLSRKSELELYFLLQDQINVSAAERDFIYGIGYGHEF